MRDTKELYDWLLQTEGSLETLYRHGAEVFSDDTDLCELLTNLSEDEKQHHNVLKDALILTRDNPPARLCVYVDINTIKSISAMISTTEQKLSSGTMTKHDMISSAAALEFSETNEIYLFAMRTLNDSIRQVMTMTFSIGIHRDRIEHFISKRPEYTHLLQSIKKIPETDSLNLLIIEEDETMKEAFDIFLSEFGHVDITPSPQSAISMLKTKPYSAVITNLKDSAIEASLFVKSVAEANPGIKKRLLFLADIDSGQTQFLDANNLKYLEKPISLHEIKTSVFEIITNNPLPY